MVDPVLTLLVQAHLAKVNCDADQSQKWYPYVRKDAAIIRTPKATSVKHLQTNSVEVGEGHPESSLSYRDGYTEPGMTKEFAAKAWKSLL